jgi:hypothetical protein
MRIQYVSKYISLSEEGLVSKLECPIDQGLLLPNLNQNDNIFLYCIECSYKKIVGIDLYNKIVNKVKEVENG